MYGQQKNAKFKSHSRCPKCKLKGKDKGGNNLGTWSDGSQYCFSCGYTSKKKPTIEQLKEKINMSAEVQPVLTMRPQFHKTLTAQLPSHARAYLASKGIMPQYRKDAEILYDEDKDSIVYPIRNKDGHIVFSNSRYLGPDTSKPRYLSQGNKSDYIKLLGNPHSPILFIVEDYLSACRIGTILDKDGVAMCAHPMFGSVPNALHMDYFQDTFFGIVFFLDADKHTEGLELKKKYTPFFPYVNYIHAMKDPKDYDMESLSNLVKAQYLCAVRNIESSLVNEKKVNSATYGPYPYCEYDD